LFDIRATLLPGGRTRLHVGIDLLIADAWSMNIMQTELGLLYEDPSRALPALALTFRDCVIVEQAQRGTSAHHRAEAYWRERLPNLPPAPELPLATDPVSVEQPRFVRRSSRLSAERWRALKAQAASKGLSPSGLLLAAFADVLAAWSRSAR